MPCGQFLICEQAMALSSIVRRVNILLQATTACTMSSRPSRVAPVESEEPVTRALHQLRQWANIHKRVRLHHHCCSDKVQGGGNT